MLFANCHLHSTFSDDNKTPEELVRLGVETGFKAMILTDHDTVSGSYFFQKAARRAGMLTMTGCEFTGMHPGTQFHIVGVDFNTENKAIREILRKGSAHQTERTHYLFDYALSHGTLRDGITWQDVLDANPDKNYICNNHVFRVMLQKGIYRKDEYMDFAMTNFSYRLPQSKAIEGDMCTKYISSAEEVIYAIRKAGGVPIIAHPKNKERYADDLLKMGALGFETAHPLVNEECRAFFEQYCDEHNLYQLGGTDHGSIFGCAADEADLPPEVGNVSEEHFMQLYRRERG